MLTYEQAKWIKTGERGTSSETMFEAFTGVPLTQHPSFPHDPDDFKRCEKLLRAVPEFRKRLNVLKRLSPVWAGFVDKWDEIVEVMESEIPGVFDNYGVRGSAPKAYEIIKDITDIGHNF